MAERAALRHACSRLLVRRRGGGALGSTAERARRGSNAAVTSSAASILERDSVGRRLSCSPLQRRRHETSSHGHEERNVAVERKFANLFGAHHPSTEGPIPRLDSPTRTHRLSRSSAARSAVQSYRRSVANARARGAREGGHPQQRLAGPWHRYRERPSAEVRSGKRVSGAAPMLSR